MIQSWILRIVLSLLALGGTFLGGYFQGKGDKEVVTEERIIKGETTTVTVEKIRWKERIVQPDGTVIEREREEDKVKDKKEKESSRTTDSETKPLAKYGLGVDYLVSLDDPLRVSRDNIGVNGSYRALGPLHVTAGYRLDNSVSIGIRLDIP